MKKVNSAAMTGFLLCFVAIVFGIMANGGIKSIFNLLHGPSAIVTFGGAICAVMMTTDSFDDFTDGVKSFVRAFQKQDMSVYIYAEKILELSNVARREGLLSLEQEALSVEDEFLKKGIMLIVDGSAPELVKDIMEAEMLHKEDKNKRNIRFWQDLGSMGPAWGMIGTLIGLILMLQNMSDASAIGPAMSVALITTLYGSILANWICSPVANKLKAYNADEIMLKEIMIEGLLSIQAGENPRVIEEKLKSFLAPAERMNPAEEGGE